MMTSFASKSAILSIGLLAATSIGCGDEAKTVADAAPLPDALAFDAAAQDPCSTLFEDDFNRADGPLGANYDVNEPTGKGDSTFEIVDNQAHPEEGGAPLAYAAYINPITESHLRASVDVNAVGRAYDGFANLIARGNTTGDQQAGYYCGFVNLKGDYRLGMAKFLTSDGEVTVLGDNGSNLVLDDGDSVRLVFELNGSALTCSISGDLTATVSATDSDIAMGSVSITGGDNGNEVLNFDNLLIETCTD